MGNTYTVSSLSFALKGPPSSKEPHALLWLSSDSGAQQPGPYRGGHGVPGHAANAPLMCLLLCAAGLRRGWAPSWDALRSRCHLSILPD